MYVCWYVCLSVCQGGMGSILYFVITSITGTRFLICFETCLVLGSFLFCLPQDNELCLVRGYGDYFVFKELQLQARYGWSVWDNELCLLLQNGDVYLETTSNVSSGGKGIILYYKNFNYRQEMFDLFVTTSYVLFWGWSCMVLKIVSAKWWCLPRDNELCLVRGYGYYFVF